MRVLILGGTGAMGMYLVQLLSSKGVETVVTSRKDKKSDGNVEYIQGNAHDIVFLNKILEEHWDAIIDFMVYTTTSFKERVNLMLNATTQYFFLSSARVYADSALSITEKSPRLLNISQDQVFLKSDEYSLAKAKQEDLLINSGLKNWTIIRPYITYSENRLQLGVLEKEEWLYRALHGRTIVFSKDIYLKKTTLTYGLDVSERILSLIGKHSAFGEIFHVVSHENKTWQEVLDIYLSQLENYLGYKPNVLLNDLDDFMKFRPHLSQYQVTYDRLFDRVFDNSKITQYIDNDNYSKLDTGLTRCLEEFLKNPHFKDINWKMEAKRDRQTNERTSLNEIQGFKTKIEYLIYRYLLI